MEPRRGYGLYKSICGMVLLYWCFRMVVSHTDEGAYTNDYLASNNDTYPHPNRPWPRASTARNDSWL